MKKKSGKNKNYEFYDYIFEKTTVRYVVMDDTKAVFMLLIPNGTESDINDNYNTVKVNDNGFPNHRDWFAGSLVHLHLSHHCTPMYENSLKLSESTKKLKFANQEVTESDGKETVITCVSADEGYCVHHILTHYKGENGFEVKCIFENNTGKSVMLEAISSASLDGLCPFDREDSSDNLVYHYFKGGWSTEGKHIEKKLCEMNMEKSWGGSYECEKIGSIGSKTVGRYYPYAALSDTANNCTWGIKLKHNATWQIELSRYGSPLSLSAGIGDYKFGLWRKKIENGQKFETPVAYVAAAKGGIDEVSNDLIEMNNRDIDAYGEDGMPIIFNDWVTHWGDTSHDKLMSLADSLSKSKVKYFVVDDGWQKGGVGDWKVDDEKFPSGIKSYSDEIRSRGMIPGIWMEFECIREKAERYSEKYDCLNLTKDGFVVKNAASNCAPTKFLDFRKPEVIEYLDKTVIQFLKNNNIGYIKVDYNANVGLGCDDADSLGEGLRNHMQAVYEFFKLIKKKIPNIVIENCSTGGSRLEPMMMSASAMSSFSDAHESVEVPIIAANMHYLISPRQSQIWCVLKDDFDDNHMRYVISTGFLGRLCWSGFIDKLNDNQLDMLYKAEDFYEKVCHIIKSGRSTVYRTDFINNRKPKGSQAVVRYSADSTEALVVCHFFEDVKNLKIELSGNYQIADSLYEHDFSLAENKLVLFGEKYSANVLHLKLKNA